MGIAAKHAYRFKFLKSEKWSNIRLEVLAKKDARCDICDHRDLSNDVHHVYYADRWDETPLEYLVVLCRPCHKRVHAEMEEPKAKMGMFVRIRAVVRQEKSLPSKPWPQYEPSARELRQSYDNLKKKYELLREEVFKNNGIVPIEKLGAERIQSPRQSGRTRGEIRKLKKMGKKSPQNCFLKPCIYCGILFGTEIFRIDREFMKKDLGGKWQKMLCVRCYDHWKKKADTIVVGNAKIARFYSNSIDLGAKRKLLTMGSL